MSPDISCAEGLAEYDVTWPWHRGPLRPGLTCVFRVRNEARNLPWVLPPMLRAVQHVVLVDNLSTDDTAEVGRRVAAATGAADRYTGTSYPFPVSRAGAEHRATAADSVHSLTHFYNWSFSQVSTAYSMKWDGDMVLTPEGEATLADLSWQLEDTETVVVVPRHPLTVVDERTGWLDLGMRFVEPWIYPMGPEFTFVKAFEWEVREWPERCERLVLPEGLCVELKWLDADEFAHWTDVGDFNSARAPRKRREWEVDRAIREGRADQVDGLVRITAPPDVHIIDHVTRTWLPQQPRPLVAPARSGAAGTSAVATPATDPGDPLRRLHGATQPVLALVHQDLGEVTDRLPPDATVVPLPAGSVPSTGRWGTVVLLAPDRDALQRSVVTLPPLQAAKEFAVYLEYAHEVAPLTPREDWERLVLVASRREGNRFLNLARFTNWMNPKAVFAEYARQAVRRSLTPHQGLRVGVTADALAPPGEVSSLRLDSLQDAGDQGRDVPPDVVVTQARSAAALPVHHVTGRAPVVVAAGPGPLVIGPLDERILNPRGFDREADPAGRRPAGRRPGDRGARTGRRGAHHRPARRHRGAGPGAASAPRGRLRLAADCRRGPGQGGGGAGHGRCPAGHRCSARLGPGAAGSPGVCRARGAGGPGRPLGPRGAQRGAPPGRPGGVLDAGVAGPGGRGGRAPPAVRADGQRGDGDQAGRPARARPGPGTPPARAGLRARARPPRLRRRPGPGRRPGRRARAHRGRLPPGRGPVRRRARGRCRRRERRRGAEDGRRRLVRPRRDHRPAAGPGLQRRRPGRHACRVPLPGPAGPHRAAQRPVRGERPLRGGGHDDAGPLDAAGAGRLPGGPAVRRRVAAGGPARRGGSVYRTHGLGYLFRRDRTGHTWQTELDYFLDPERLRARWDGLRPSRLLELDPP